MKLSILSDAHLDRIAHSQLTETSRALMATVKAYDPDVFVILGDTSDSSRLIVTLQGLQLRSTPTLVLLGNHDYYGSSYATARDDVRKHCATSSAVGVDKIRPSAEPIQLGANYLVAIDGMCDPDDDFETSVSLSDFCQIAELRQYPHKRHQIMREIACADNKLLRSQLSNITDSYATVIVLSHYPLFREMSTYKRKVSEDNFARYFYNEAGGQALLEFSERHDGNIYVFCGHTHDYSYNVIGERIHAFTLEAAYGCPTVYNITL